jgi:serine/threonine protein phosphatase 1
VSGGAQAGGETGAEGAAARLPAGVRIYATGDIHGRFDLLESLYGAIRRELQVFPPERSIEIFLGDYIDRGPESREVLEWLISAPPACDERVCLLGNHEDMLLKVLNDPHWTGTWLQNGGVETLRSYAVDLTASPQRTTLDDLRAAFLDAFPDKHRAFLKRLPRLVGAGGYLFVHAGIRPGVALDEQDPDDLVWIRDEFLLSEADFGRIVVHGHTPVEEPEVRANRINVDTGAFFTGRLTTLVLEEDGVRFLRTA